MLGNSFLTTPKAQANKKEENYIRKPLYCKLQHQESEKTPTEWEKI